jgi:hypothetical protein
MIVRGMGKRKCVAFIPLTIIPLTFPALFIPLPEPAVSRFTPIDRALPRAQAAQRRNFKRGKNGPAFCRLGEFGKIKLRRLFQIGQGLLEGLALSGRSRLWMMRHEPITLRVGTNDGCKMESFLSRLHVGEYTGFLFGGQRRPPRRFAIPLGAPSAIWPGWSGDWPAAPPAPGAAARRLPHRSPRAGPPQTIS